MAPLYYHHCPRTVWAGEMSKDKPSEKSKGYLFGICYSKGVSHVTCFLAETQKQAEDWASFLVE